MSTSDNGTTRTWIYHITLDASGLDVQTDVPVYAVGVDANGDALMSAANATLDIIDS